VLRLRMHWPIPAQGKWLGQVVAGYYNYHAVPTNFRSLVAFRAHVTTLWLRTLRRRSQKDRINCETKPMADPSSVPSRIDRNRRCGLTQRSQFSSQQFTGGVM